MTDLSRQNTRVKTLNATTKIVMNQSFLIGLTDQALGAETIAHGRAAVRVFRPMSVYGLIGFSWNGVGTHLPPWPVFAVLALVILVSALLSYRATRAS